MKINPQARKQQLLEAGVYDANSLVLNLQGRLSTRQQIKLVIHSLLWFSLSGINLIGLILLLFLQFLHIEMLPVSIIWMIALAVFGFLGYQHTRPFWKDIQDGQIKTVSGRIKKDYFHVGGARYRANAGGNSYFLVHIHNIQFSVSPTLYSSLIDGGSYRLFYVPNSGWVLNVDAA